MSNENTKIKLVVGISDFRIGGAQKVVADIIGKINLTQFDVHLIVLSNQANQETFYELVPADVVVHKLNFVGFKDLASWRELYALLKKIKPDVVWSHLYFSNTVFRVLKPVLGYKVVTVEHNTYVNKTFAQKVVDWILALFTYRIVAVSDYVADFTAKQEYIPRRKFVTIHNGVDIASIHRNIQSYSKESVSQELGVTSEHKIILNVGQLISQKNQELLIEAFSVFSETNPQYCLVILGEGSLRNRLESLIIERGLAGKVFLPGIKKNVSEYMARSDFFVLSSKFEGFPIVAIEALACSLPIISTPVSSSDVYTKEGHNGFLAEHDKASLVSAMTRLSQLSALDKESFKENSLKLATNFDITSVARSYEVLFKESIARS